MMMATIYLFLVLVVYGLVQAKIDLKNDSVLPKDCGKSCPRRIVGGYEVTQNCYRWQAAINQTGSFICGASVINQRWILCAAHCVSFDKNVTPVENLKVLLGAHRIEPTHDGQLYSVSRIIPHENYNEVTMQNDISLLRLTDPIDFSKTEKTIAPVCVAGSPVKNLEVGQVTALGWGTTSSGGKISPVLHQVEVPIVDQKTCQSVYGKDDITEKNICAGLKKGGKDSCQGDSGGPLIFKQKNQNRWMQVGITSWGNGCAGENAYGVYTRVSSHYEWIQKTIKKYNSSLLI